MKLPVFIALSLLAGVTVGFTVSMWLNRIAMKRLRNKNRALKKALDAGQPPHKTETMKKFVWACEINGFLWVWCSYILAALDKPQIAEELSKVALVEIIAPVVVYAFKSVVENLSKNNNWPDKLSIPDAPEVIPDVPDASGDEDMSGLSSEGSDMI